MAPSYCFALGLPQFGWCVAVEAGQTGMHQVLVEALQVRKAVTKTCAAEDRYSYIYERFTGRAC